MKILNLLFLLSSSMLFSQTKITRVLWNKVENKPIEYATIKETENYTISNENGVFEFEETTSKITIQSLVFEKLNIDFDFLRKNDTIFMKPLIYQLDEIIISKDGLYKKMLKTVLTDYALEPHKEEFFLRAVIRKNNELFKIVDFSGLVEKKSLFDTKSKPMPKKNYKVQINNIRKVGIENRNVDFEMFSFKTFFTYLIRLSFSPDDFNISYEVSANKSFTKVILEPKVKTKTFYKGYYVLSEDNTFREANITYINKSSTFENIRKTKYRTTFMNWKSNFERNQKSNKLQINKATIKAKTELITGEIRDIYDVNYIYYARPINKLVKVKNTDNLNIDMFELKGKYDFEYWKNHKILTLTNEMQEFINKVNSSGKNSDFKTKTNIN